MRLDPPEPFSDGRVSLRDIRPEDAAAFVRPFADDEFAWLVGSREDPTEASVLEDIEQEPDRRAEGRSATFAVAETPSDEFLGTVVLFGVDWEHARGELGIWLMPEARGRGLAHSALRLLASWALDGLGLMRLEMKTTVENAAMQRTAEAVGFRREGVLRSYDDVRGRRDDLVLLSLLPGELSEA